MEERSEKSQPVDETANEESKSKSKSEIEKKKEDWSRFFVLNNGFDAIR